MATVVLGTIQRGGEAIEGKSCTITIFKYWVVPNGILKLI